MASETTSFLAAYTHFTPTKPPLLLLLLDQKKGALPPSPLIRSISRRSSGAFVVVVADRRRRAGSVQSIYNPRGSRRRRRPLVRDVPGDRGRAATAAGAAGRRRVSRRTRRNPGARDAVVVVSIVVGVRFVVQKALWEGYPRGNARGTGAGQRPRERLKGCVRAYVRGWGSSRMENAY